MTFRIVKQTALTPDVYELTLAGDTRKITKPGMFVNIKLDGFFLRRPISVCDWSDGSLTLIYKVVGHGTKYMAQLPIGAELDLLTGLGNGFSCDIGSSHPLVIGGGVGVPPMYALTKLLIAAGQRPTVIAGFNRSEECFYEDKFKALGAEVIITTVDGSYGEQGFVTTPMPNLSYDYTYACGPEPMLRALFKASGDVPGQYSFEERMACGFGACMGCSCGTVAGPIRICKEGPVLPKEAILW